MNSTYTLHAYDEVYSPRRQYNTIQYKAIQGNTVYTKKLKIKKHIT